MLSVVIDLALAAATLIGIFALGNPVGLDSLNDPTRRPFPGASAYLGIDPCAFK